VVAGGLLTPLEEAVMKALMDINRLKKTALMVAWICLFCAGLQFPLTPAWSDRQNQQFQGVIMEKDSRERAIYVNEMNRDVRLSFQSLRNKQWVFIRVRSEGKNLIADSIVLIPRYIPPKERGKYRFFKQTRVSK
jgi:hypothetical protein